MTGIYKITNINNGLIYVGQSKNISARIKRHQAVPFNKSYREYNTPLHRAIREEGIKNFLFEVVEEVSVSELNVREKYWINYYHSDCQQYGYNQTAGGQGRNVKLTTGVVDNITQELLSSNLDQQSIADKYGVSVEMVQGINTGRHWKRNNIKYPIHQYFAPKIKKEPYKEILRKKYLEIGEKFDREEILRLSYKSFSAAARYAKLDKRMLKKILCSWGCPIEKENFRSWYEDNFVKKDKEPLLVIEQYNFDNILVATYYSWFEAAKSIGKGLSNYGGHIRDAANKPGKSAYGYWWISYYE